MTNIALEEKTMDLGGFSITSSTSTTMLIIFAIYSIVIVGMGFYIKYAAKKGGTDNLASFLTGGGGLGAFAIAMIAATNSMAGGTMINALWSAALLLSAAGLIAVSVLLRRMAKAK